MSFLDKYKVEALTIPPKGLRDKLNAEDTIRAKIKEAIAAQRDFLRLRKEGRSVELRKYGKVIKPRFFWIEVDGVMYFTPRFGNDFIFGGNSGVMLEDEKALHAALNDFEAAVDRGEFDERLKEIAGSRKGRGLGKAGRKPGSKSIKTQ
jgi:hypothetical protein